MAVSPERFAPRNNELALTRNFALNNFMQHPIQPLQTDAQGVLRFKENLIVRNLLEFAETRGMDMNTIAVAEHSNEDRQQFAQLIGYSLSGYAELRSYVDDAAYMAAEAKSKNSKKSDVEIERDYYRDEIKVLRKSLQKPMARLFEVH